MTSAKLFQLRSLSEQDESALIAQHGAELLSMLPVLGPLFGLAVALFGVWDYLIDPNHAAITLALRVLLILAGSLGYWQTRLPWTPVQRYGYIYWTHASAIIICEFLLKDGFIFGLAGIVACVFTVSIATLRVRTFLLILSVPTALFIILSAISLPPLSFINNLILYFFALGLACMLMLVIRSFRQKAFLLEKELLHISRHDSLTGCCNRRYLTELAEREVALSKRHGRTLAVIMLDIDHFKQINDTYGHHIGDNVIKQLVKTCTENLREIDHFGRLGGEEFVCVLPEADEAEAMGCADRLRRAIEALLVETPQGPIRFTISSGVAVLEMKHVNWEALLKDADAAMYRAKREGRNRVVLSPLTDDKRTF
ncbi:MAG: GGDEF domain-containing protein [Burkholderiaceae bacterium]